MRIGGHGTLKVRRALSWGPWFCGPGRGMLGSWYFVFLGVFVGFESAQWKNDQFRQWHSEAQAMLGDDDPDVRAAALALRDEIAQAMQGGVS